MAEGEVESAQHLLAYSPLGIVARARGRGQDWGGLGVDNGSARVVIYLLYGFIAPLRELRLWRQLGVLFLLNGSVAQPG